MPAQTMTQLLSDSFLPTALTGGDPHIPPPRLTSDSATTIISPLTLPRGVAGYFDHVTPRGVGNSQPATAAGSSDAAGPYKGQRSQVYSPLSPGAKGPVLHSASSFSTPVPPSTMQRQMPLDQHRSSSLPPKTRNRIIPRIAADGGYPRAEMSIGLGSNGWGPTANGSVPLTSMASAQLQCVSPDAVGAPPHDLTVQRLQQQNARIREAWEAERKYLEANRERAEEVYKEERALMEEERAEWETEKAALLQEILRLRQALGVGDAGSLASNGEHPFSRTSFSNLGQRGGSQPSSRISPNSSLSSQGGSQPRSQGDRPGFLNGNPSVPVTKPRYLDLASPRLPNGPSAPASDFLKSAEASETEASGPVPIVDVKEIHPELEGIPIKATSVKKATFTDNGSPNGSKVSSMVGSPPPSADQVRSPQAKKEQTLQVLAAEETARLTMHAGHTPNHSLSSLATVASSGTATATSNGGDSTPTMPQDESAGSRDSNPAVDARGAQEAMSTAAPVPDVVDRHGRLIVDHPQPILEPSEDPELKGPLMVRNMPAHDEVFFQKLNNKLEEVSKDTNAALPAVLKDSEPAGDTGNAAEQSKAPYPEAAGSDAGSEGSKSTPNSGDEEDVDVPLKFKKRLNFGAPFGEMR